ncbi:FAD-dependent oxidoreductase [Chloroflexota bacterium]
MVSIKAEEHENCIQTDAVIIGNSTEAIQSALTMAKMSIKVDMILDCAALGCDDMAGLSQNYRYLWPLLVQVTSHPMITLHMCSKVEQVFGEKGSFELKIIQQPRYIDDYLCTGCGRCQAECSVEVTRLLNDSKITHNAVHRPLLNEKSLPSTYKIDKQGISPCLVSCPLGINVQGFISLIAKGKVDKALELINESAPFAGVLGRVCVHPCEGSCNRVNIDDTVSIQALHRYAADNAFVKTKYKPKLSPKPGEGKIAIVGSGPTGLTAAWKLTLLGYSPTVFEAHGVIGGMLATGIPRFRLPREIREREIEAIKNLGVDIRTGITVGRDVTFTYLKERGYKAFFLSIGAQKNNKLNIPGEDLDGVVDCMSLLLTLNLKVDTFVGENIVVIGDGNSAIDSARAAIRRSGGKVRILSWTVPEEITAAQDALEEALQEKVSIDYLTAPLEILGDGGMVTGIRCQRTRLTDDIMQNGRHRPESIPDTDFIIDADHVVVAIGQSPNTTQLNIEGLYINGDTGSIQADPLTLETNIQGVFAGGDCISGPNNVVEAMAAGLRAAESIHRFIQGQDLRTGRELETVEETEFDINTIEAYPHKRAVMPTIGSRKRTNSFEETTRGLSKEVAQTEAMRCLSCAICSNCMECKRVCEIGAVLHDDTTRHFKIAAQTILVSSSTDSKGFPLNENVDIYNDINGIRTLAPVDESDFNKLIANAMAIAIETAADIKTRQEQANHFPVPAEIEAKPVYPYAASDKPSSEKRLGIVLCRCSGSISSVIDFSTVTKRLKASTDVTSVTEIVQACTEEGANQIAQVAIDNQLDSIVLAACRCCGLDQTCYSCTDRRSMCLHSLDNNQFLQKNTAIEFVNIREQCSWIHNDNPRGATRVASQVISAAAVRAKNTPLLDLPKTPAKRSVIVFGGGISGIYAARALLSLGIHTELVVKETQEQTSSEQRELLSGAEKHSDGLVVRPWPISISLEGRPGNYVAVLEYESRAEHISAGAILIDVEEVSSIKDSSPGLFSNESLVGKIITKQKHANGSINPGIDLLRDITIGNCGGIFMFPSIRLNSTQDHKLRGLAAAARISTYLERQSITQRATTVHIEQKICRGCGTCVAMCPYIETQVRMDGTFYASVDHDFCLGCGACISVCPSGAITQLLQSDTQILDTLHSILRPNPIFSKVR